MRIVVHPPTVSAPDGTEHVAAVVLAAVRAVTRELGGSEADEDAEADMP